MTTLDVRVLAPSGERVDARLEHRPAGAPEGAWQALGARGGVARLATLGAGLDLRAWASGLRVAEVRGACGVQEIQLEPGYSVSLRLTRPLDVEGAEECVLGLLPEHAPFARSTACAAARDREAFALVASVAGRHAVRVWLEPPETAEIPPCESPFEPHVMPPTARAELVLGFVDVRPVDGEQVLWLDPGDALLARLPEALRGRSGR